MKGRIVIKSEEERLVYGEVYAPMRVDTDEEAMTSDEIRKMAHRFLSEGRTDKIDVQHNFEESGSLVVESFIARKNDPDDFVEDSWVLGVLIPEDIWPAVKSGEINGFSFAGMPDGGKKVLRTVVRKATRMEGSTEKSDGGPIPIHEHAIDLKFGSDGRIVQTDTSESFGHRHAVRKATATEKAFDHSHRMILIDNQ